MASFTSSLSPSSDAVALFVDEKYGYKDKKGVLPKDLVKKINSFISVLKNKKDAGEINSFDVSNKQKCFVVKIKNKYPTNKEDLKVEDDQSSALGSIGLKPKIVH